MKCKAGNLILIVILAAVGWTACRKNENNRIAGTTPIEQLIQAGKSPIEAGPMSRKMNRDATEFVMTLTNVSDTPVKEFDGTIILYDENGKALADTIMRSSYNVAPGGNNKLPPINPGAKFDVIYSATNEKAVSGMFIIREVLYKKKVDPKFKDSIEMWLKWTNKDYDAILKAEKAK